MRTHSHGAGLCPYTNGLCKAYQEQLRIIKILKDTQAGAIPGDPFGDFKVGVLDAVIKLIGGVAE